MSYKNASTSDYVVRVMTTDQFQDYNGSELPNRVYVFVLDDGRIKIDGTYYGKSLLKAYGKFVAAIRRASDDGVIPHKLGYCFAVALGEIRDEDGCVINLDSSGYGSAIFYESATDAISFEDNEESFYFWSNQSAENFFDKEEICDERDMVPIISRVAFDTILLHAEKISIGQHDFAGVLRRDLKDKLGIGDAESLISDLMKSNAESYNRTRRFLSQFDFIVEGDNGTRYQLVRGGIDDYCALEIIDDALAGMKLNGSMNCSEQFTNGGINDETTQAVTSKSRLSTQIAQVENNTVADAIPTLEQRANKIRQLQLDVQRGIIEIGFELIAAKKEIGHGGWTDWLQKEFKWTQQTANNYMRVAERFGNEKLKNVFQFQSSVLIKMLALPVGDEEKFVEEQANAGRPIESQSAREVCAAVKKWKQDKLKERLPVSEFDEEKFADTDLEMKREETAKLLNEIAKLIRTTTGTLLTDTIRDLKSIRAVLKAKRY